MLIQVELACVLMNKSEPICFPQRGAVSVWCFRTDWYLRTMNKICEQEDTNTFRILLCPVSKCAFVSLLVRRS